MKLKYNKRTGIRKIIKTIVILFFPLFINAQCWFDQHLLDIDNPKVSDEFKAYFDNPPQSHYDAYEILYEQAKNSRTKMDKLFLVRDNLDIARIGNYKGLKLIFDSNADLLEIMKNKFSNADERAEFIKDLFNNKKIEIPPSTGVRGLISSKANIQVLTEAHLDAWIALKKYPNLRRGFKDLDGFSHVLSRFNKLDESLQKEFLETLNTATLNVASQTNKVGASGAVSVTKLLVNNIKNFKNVDKGDDIIEAWLELRKYADDVNARYNFEDIAAIADKALDVETVVLNYGLRDYNLAQLLQKFGYSNCAASARATGAVATNTFARLKAGVIDRAFGRKFDDIVEAYEVIIDGKKMSIKDFKTPKEFFDALKNTDYFNVFESHHVLVVELFKSPGFRKWYDKIGYTKLDLNGESSLLNVIMLEKFKDAKGVHASHSKYNEAIINVINERWDKYLIQDGLTEADAISKIDRDILRIRRKVKEKLVKESVIGQGEKLSSDWQRTKVNDLIDEASVRAMLN